MPRLTTLIVIPCGGTHSTLRYLMEMRPVAMGDICSPKEQASNVHVTFKSSELLFLAGFAAPPALFCLCVQKAVDCSLQK